MECFRIFSEATILKGNGIIKRKCLDSRQDIKKQIPRKSLPKSKQCIFRKKILKILAIIYH